jgi:hypothetical protein
LLIWTIKNRPENRPIFLWYSAAFLEQKGKEFMSNLLGHESKPLGGPLDALKLPFKHGTLYRISPF